MKLPKAFLFDLNGTMIDDMAFHLEAWSRIVNDDLAGNRTREEVKKNMYGKNEDLLFRIFGHEKFSREELNRLSIQKEEYYQEAYKPSIALIPGLDKFIVKATANGILMGIGSAAVPDNINFIIDNLDLRKYFKTIVSADDVTHSKPDPETFLKVASGLGIRPVDCVVFEDAPKGVESAENAGMRCVALTTMHDQEDFSSYSNVIMFISDYTDPRLESLFE
jgi:beta-phosphoglucomutase